MTETSLPGQGSDPLEKDFEEMLQKEGLELTGREKPVVEKPADPPAPAKEKEEEPEDKDPKDGKDSKEKKPAEDKKPEDKPKEGTEEWRTMIAKRRQEKARLAGKDPKDPESGKPDPLKPVVDPKKPEDKVPVLTDEQKALADKYGIDHEDYLKMYPPAKEKEIVKEVLSDEDRKVLDTVKSERDALLVEKGFNTDFDSNVLPLIKEEYPNISPEKLAEIRQQILEKLETDQYALTPLDVIYRGDQAFRGLVKKREGVDHGNRVPAKGNADKMYDFDNATEEDIKRPDFPFEEYSAYMEKKEKGRRS